MALTVACLQWDSDLNVAVHSILAALLVYLSAHQRAEAARRKAANGDPGPAPPTDPGAVSRTDT